MKPFNWDYNKQREKENFEKKVEEISQYVSSHGRLPTKRTNKILNDRVLYFRKRYKLNQLATQQIKSLNKIGVISGTLPRKAAEEKPSATKTSSSAQTLDWRKRVKQVTEYLLRRKQPLHTRKAKDEILRSWLKQSIKRLNEGKLADKEKKEIAQLKRLYQSIPKRKSWLENSEEVKKIILEEKRPFIRKTDNSLFIWYRINLKLLKDGKLPGEKKIIIKELEALVKQIPKPPRQNIAEIRQLRWHQHARDVKNILISGKALHPTRDIKLTKWVKAQIKFPHRLIGDRKQVFEEIKLLYDSSKIKRVGQKAENWMSRAERIKNTLILHKTRAVFNSADIEWITYQTRRYYAKLSDNKRKMSGEIKAILSQTPHAANRQREQWYITAKNIKEFLLAEKRLPYSTKEPVFYVWLKKYQKPQKHNRLSDDKKKIFEEINLLAIDLPPLKPYMISLWYVKAEEIKRFLKTRNRLPSYKNEPRFADWLKRYLRLYNRKELPEEKMKIFEEIQILVDALPGSVRTKRKSWRKTMTEIKKMLTKENRLPSFSKDRFHYSWMYRNLKLQTRGILPVEREQKIKEIKNIIDNIREDAAVKAKNNALAKSKLIEQRAYRWQSTADEVKQFLLNQKKMPSKRRNKALYFWLRRQKKSYEEDKLTDTKKKIFEEVKVLINNLPPKIIVSKE